jgi:predicted nuclease of restriction endonuclease-like RecB superfamily
VLTAELVRARRQGTELKLTELGAKLRPRAIEIVADLVALAEAHVGQTRADLQEAFASVEVKASEHKLALGLRKLVEDRLEFEMESPLDPRALRAEVFGAAAEARRALGPGSPLERDAFLSEEASRRGLSTEQLLRALYADLRQAQIVKSFDAIAPERLVDGFDLAQKQAVLLRAVDLVADLHCGDAYAYRALFRKLKFFRLLHRIEARSDGGYRVHIDGPFSLFTGASKYGLELALALPALMACDRYTITARIRWGKERLPLSFVIEGHAATPSKDAPLPDEVESLRTKFAALDSPWIVEPASDILSLPGVGLCVPDLRFLHEETGEIAYLEVLGYWSRDAVWKRVELAQRGLTQRVLFAVSSRLRVSEQVLGEDSAAELYVYKGSLSAREVRKRLDVSLTRGGTSGLDTLPSGP